MPKRFLFVVGQAGTVSYLLPLWQRWLGQPDRAAVIWATPEAATRFAGSGVMPDLVSETLAEHPAAWATAAADAVVISASGTGLERETHRLAQQHGKPTIAVLDTWYGFARRLADGLPDWALVIDDVAKDMAIAEGIPDKILAVTGQPAWEDIRPLPAGEAGTVLFVSQPVRKHYADRLGYDEHSAYAMLTAAQTKRPDLIGRLLFAPHPGDERQPAGAETVSAKDGIRIASMVTGLFSSALVEAVLAGRSVIALHPGQTRPALSAFGDRAVVPGAGDVDTLISLLEQKPTPAPDFADDLMNSCQRLDAFFQDRFR